MGTITLVPNTYTEADPNGHLSEDATTVSAAALNRNEAAYVYKDYTAGFFAGNFSQKGKSTKVAPDNNNGLMYLGGMAQGINKLATGVANVIGFFRMAGGSVNDSFSLYEYYGSAYFSVYINLPKNVTYYYTFERVGNVLYQYIYSDAARTNLLGLNSITLHATLAYRYHYLASTYNDGMAAPYTGTNEGLTLTAAGLSGQSVLQGGGLGDQTVLMGGMR